jgi:hypothetical protein
MTPLSITPHQESSLIEIAKAFPDYKEAYVARTEDLLLKDEHWMGVIFDSAGPRNFPSEKTILRSVKSLTNNRKNSAPIKFLDGITALLLSGDVQRPNLLISAYMYDEMPRLKVAMLDPQLFIGEMADIERIPHAHWGPFEMGLTTVVKDIFTKGSFLGNDPWTLPSPKKWSPFESRRKNNEEDWKLVETTHARVLEVSEETVVLECLVDKENKIFENKRFDKKLLEGVLQPQDGKFVIIQEFFRPGEIRFKFRDGDNDFTSIEEQLATQI